MSAVRSSAGGRSGPRLLAILPLLAGPWLGCADTVKPVLGGLKIGSAASPFHPPALTGDGMPFEYPEDAWDQGVGGETVLRIHISSGGAVDSARVVRSSGHRSLDSAAVAGALKLRYRPARHGDEPVPVWGILPVRYPMPERAASDSLAP